MHITVSGEATTMVAPLVPGGVSDGQWHSVQVQYYNKVREDVVIFPTTNMLLI